MSNEWCMFPPSLKSNLLLCSGCHRCLPSSSPPPPPPLILPLPSLPLLLLLLLNIIRRYHFRAMNATSQPISIWSLDSMAHSHFHFRSFSSFPSCFTFTFVDCIRLETLIFLFLFSHFHRNIFILSTLPPPPPSPPPFALLESFPFVTLILISCTVCISVCSFHLRQIFTTNTRQFREI